MKTKLFLLVHLTIFSVSAQHEITPVFPKIMKQFPNVRDLAIAPNGDEIMFSAQSVMGNLSSIISVKKKHDTWQSPQVASFSGKHFDLEPFFSHDGLKLYFVSTRPLVDTTLVAKDFDIWYVERSDLNQGWSKPKNMGPPINTEHGEFYPSIANNGNLYFTRDNPTLKRRDDIYMSPYVNGEYEKAIALNDSINSDGYEYNAFIAPDESYLIFGCYNREDGLGSGDLYISYRSKSGWSTSQNMTKPINSEKMDYCPFIDSKTQTLYFTSKRDNTTTSFKKPIDIDALKNEFERYDNGASRIYKTHFNLDTLKH
ncbi:TolB-like translocation protein [Changchengzhania lutea]|uniref:PD40 domain-containing protein n=1 Tax=Changchengzhania lutea TaxID=2049305 RepID=UPI00115F291A|nr:PD40 domain-containing protein [Changchengzhania lutea]